MTTPIELLESVQFVLNGRTAAEDRIAIPGDLPTQPDQLPILKVRIVAESKQSTGRGSIGFTTIVTIRVMGEVSELADIDDDMLVSAVQAKLLALKAQVERAIINSYPLFRIVQQLVSVQTQFAYTANATHLAGIQSDYAFEIFESADDFAPLDVDDITEMHAVDPLHPPIGIHFAEVAP